MSPKRRTGRRTRKQSPVISRLNRKRRHDGFTNGGVMRGDSVHMPGRDRAPGFRLLTSLGFALALLTGIISSRSVIQHVQAGETSGDPVRVRSVAVLGNQRLSAASVAQASGVAPDSIATRLDTKQIARTLERHPLIGSARSIVLPHGQLVVSVEERNPVALLRGRPGAKQEVVWRLVDSTGTPFANTRAEAWSRLPRLRSARARATGVVDPTLVEAIRIAMQIDRERAPAVAEREIELPTKGSGIGWVLHSQTLPHRVILGTQDLEPRLERLAMLLDADLPTARGVEEIDLRFADQAVLRGRSSFR